MKISGPYSYRNTAGQMVERSKPWRLYHRGQQSWYVTEAEAIKAGADMTVNVGRAITKRHIDEYWHCAELLKGVSLLRAARFYIEHHDGQMKNAGETVAKLVEKFKLGIKGRKKYVQEAKRNLSLLVDAIGTLRITAVTPGNIEDFLNGFASAWSHDDALKFSRSFFKWCIGPKVKAIRTNPTAEFDFKKPGGSRVYLTLADSKHILKITRKEFPAMLPAIGLQMFQGIRTEEITRLEWRYVKQGKIRLEPEVAKMGQVKGKRVPRFIDWCPVAMNACLPRKIPKKGKVAPWYKRLKTRILKRCIETKPDFKWGQNAFRHSFGTYGLAFFQSADRIAKLMGERDVDTVFNHYADYEEMKVAQLYFSIGSDKLEAFPVPKNAMQLIQEMVNAAQPKTEDPKKELRSA